MAFLGLDIRQDIDYDSRCLFCGSEKRLLGAGEGAAAGSSDKKSVSKCSKTILL